MTASTTHNLQVVQGLAPAQLWTFFAGLSDLPRPSKQEHRVLSWLQAFADERQLVWRRDATGNMVICRPGSAGGEAAQAVCVQGILCRRFASRVRAGTGHRGIHGHIDMVTEKNDDVVHDFLSDPIRFRLDGEWLKATGTTLGADNGIGVAAALSLLDQPTSVKLPPLECLFTVDEETGLTGAKTIDPSLVTARTMLNLDTEEWGEICIGCAGGGDTYITFNTETEPAAPGAAAFTLRLDGLLGGHSGLNINEDRANAVQLMCRVLLRVVEALPSVRIARVDGGDKRNAIAREASALLMLGGGADGDAEQGLRAVVATLADKLRSEYGLLEAGMALRLAPAPLALPALPVSRVLAPAAAGKLLRMAAALPHGVIKKSHAIAGLVETSNNVASIKPSAEAPSSASPAASSAGSSSVSYTVVAVTRSSLGHALEVVRDNIEATARAFGAASVTRSDAYPGWAPDLASYVLKVTKDEYRTILGGKDAQVGAVHAGLECGLLGGKFPGMDTVSYGPTIRGAHSPDERVLVSTVAPFWDLTLAVCSALADRR
ncbi:hypothetical protein FOA52_007868 [Chlamydomonas sp. UWO 241]|nr:hypothetical protein FOA52_007868 [Chlamydomonas sp. UWO 241]